MNRCTTKVCSDRDRVDLRKNPASDIFAVFLEVKYTIDFYDIANNAKNEFLI